GFAFPSDLCSRYDVFWLAKEQDAQLLGRVKPSANGDLTLNFTLPTTATGTYNVVTIGEGFSVGATLQITGEAVSNFVYVPPSPSASISVTPTSGAPGTPLTIRGSGFSS